MEELIYHARIPLLLLQNIFEIESRTEDLPRRHRLELEKKVKAVI